MEPRVYQEYFEQDATHWWFQGRRKIVFDLLDKYLPLRNGNVLDVGCGTGGMLEPLKRFGEVSGIDSSTEAIQYCRTRGFANVKQGDLKSVAKNEFYDLICFFDVLEHLPDDEEALLDTYSKLKSGAYLVITVPAFQFLWGKQDVLVRHYRRYTLDQLQLKLSKKGFRVIHHTYFNFFLFLPILVYRWIENRFAFQKNDEQSDLAKTPGFFNRYLEGIFSFERYLLRWIRFPFGVSIFCLAHKMK